MIDPVSGMDMSQFTAPPPSAPQDGGDIPSGTPMMRITPQAAQPSPRAKGVDPVSGIDFDESQFPPVPSPPVKATPGGMMRNVAAGLQEGAAGTMNVLSDPFGNLVGKPLLTAGGFVHDALAPALGYQRLTPEQRADLSGDDVPQPGTRLVNAFDQAVGMPTPDQIPANGTAEQLVRKGVGAATSMVGLGPAGGLSGPLLNAAMGAGGAIAGDQAARFVPEWAQPMTELAGNVLGNLGAAGVANLGGKLANAGMRTFGNMGVGAKEAIGGTPATATQIENIGGKIQKAAGGEGQAAIEAATAQPGMGAPTNGELVEESKPTTAQLAPTPGLVEMEKAARVASPEAFNATAATQNNARVDAIRGLAPESAEPALLGQHFTQMLQDIDARHAGEMAADRDTLQTTGQNAIDAAQQTAEQQRAAMTQGAQQSSQMGQRAVQRLTQGVGGTTAPDVTGQVIRGSLMERNKSAKAANKVLWDAVDPDGNLTLPLGDVQQTAKSLIQDIKPNLGDVLGPQESLILNGAAALPEVVPFKQAQRLWSNIGTAERALRAAPGNEQSLRRLGMLKSSLNDAIANGATEAAAGNPEIAARIQALGGGNDATVVGQRGERIPPTGTLPGSPGGEGSLPGQGGEQRQESRGSGSASGNSPMAPAAANEGAAETLVTPGSLRSERGSDGQRGLTPNFDADAATRYADARQGTLREKQIFGRGPVGAVLRPGRQGAEFNVENAAVARQFLTGNSTEPARVQQLIQATGGEPQATAAVREALVGDLRQRRIINEEGMVQPDRLKAWLQPEARGRTVDLFPGLRDQLGTAEAAQRTYDQTVSDHAARLDAFNKQAALDHVARVRGLEGTLKDFDRVAADVHKTDTRAFNQTGGQFVNSEPMDALRRIFASKTRTQDLDDIVSQAKGKPEVLDGLKRLTADYIEQRFSGAKPSGDDTDFLRSDQFRKFIDDRREPLKVIFGGQGVQNLEMVAADLRRQATATAAPATPGSDTVSKLIGAAKHGAAAVGHGLGQTAFMLIGEQLMEHAATLASHSPVISAVAGVGGVLGGYLLNTLRQAGIKTRGDLIREAMLNPAVAKELMTRAASRNAISQMSQRRIARAIQASIVNNAVGQSNQEPKK